jgi:hypothetical protein
MLFCRVHGEPLRYNVPCAWWECPVRHVCGTFVGDEILERMGRLPPWPWP